MVDRVFGAAKESLSGKSGSRQEVAFTYMGKSALTITGTVSGKTYRFENPGETRLVDYRDAPAFILVKLLKKQ